MFNFFVNMNRNNAQNTALKHFSKKIKSSDNLYEQNNLFINIS